MMNYLTNPPKNLFFTGKGGVGKTTTSAATAIALADSGKRVLLVSTDPASNLDEVLGLALSAEPAEVPDVPGLFAINVNPVEAAASRWSDLIVESCRMQRCAAWRNSFPALALSR